MDYIDYLWIKFFVLVFAAFAINLVYSALTGKTLGQAQTDKEAAPRED